MLNRKIIEELAIGDGILLPGNLEQSISCQVDSAVRPAGVPAHYYRFLFRLVGLMKPALVLELGTSYGHSSSVMADACPDSKIITVNIMNELREECRRQNVVYVNNDSLVKVDLDRSIDILFIDTEHDGIRCEKEFDLYCKNLSKDSIVLFDDIHWTDGMRRFWPSFNPAGFEKFEIPAHGDAGFGVLLPINEAQEA